MGRRSINTTKSGKYMNPTDQARKEARKKELKKNKRQRQMVRAAVLKMKDPQQILAELEKIDEMEYNVLQPSPLNEKVLKEKRKKLKETFDRVLKMYDKDEPEKWLELKRQEVDYEKKRAHLISYYDSVKHAQAVQIDDIPLPTLQLPENGMFTNAPDQIPLPADKLASVPRKPILKKDTAYKEMAPGTEPPGVPPGPPPNLREILMDIANISVEEQKEEKKLEKKKQKGIKFSDDIADDGPPGDDDVNEAGKPTPQPTSLQRRMLALSGQNIDDFMKEMEEVHRKREREKAADLSARLAALPPNQRPPPPAMDDDSDSDTEMHPPPPPLRIAPPPLIPPPSSMVPPPPSLVPMPPGLAPPPLALGIRPPRPPPRLPPRPPLLAPPMMPAGVLSAAPKIMKSATISAAPQITNLSKEVTRFVPSSLRIKREDKKKNKPKQKAPDVSAQPTKDDALEQFMKEMQHLL